MGQALDRVLTGVSGPGPSRWITGPNSNRERSKIGPIVEACNSTSFDPANRWKMPSLNRLTDACETSV